MREENSFFSFEKLTDTTYMVRETLTDISIFNIYVIVGRETVIVVDAGLGMFGNIRTYIEENIVSGKPMICVLTHGDLDHIGGVKLFDKVYMNERDVPALPQNMDVERRYGDLETLCHDDEEIVAFAKAHFIPNEGFLYENIDDGDVIDAGGVRLIAYALPGHTPGCIVYYNKEEGYLIGGDSLQCDGSCKGGKEGYLESIAAYDRLLERIPEDTVIYNSHEFGARPYQLIPELKAVMEEVLEKKIEGDPKLVPLYHFKHAKAAPKRNRRKHSLGMVNIGYDRDEVMNW